MALLGSNPNQTPLQPERPKHPPKLLGVWNEHPPGPASPRPLRARTLAVRQIFRKAFETGPYWGAVSSQVQAPCQPSSLSVGERGVCFVGPHCLVLSPLLPIFFPHSPLVISTGCRLSICVLSLIRGPFACRSDCCVSWSPQARASFNVAGRLLFLVSVPGLSPSGRPNAPFPSAYTVRPA